MEKVKKLRLEVGMSQKELINILGVKQSHYSSLENGVYLPKNRDETKKKVVDILKPLLMQKLIEAQKEVERIENLVLQWAN